MPAHSRSSSVVPPVVIEKRFLFVLGPLLLLLVGFVACFPSWRDALSEAGSKPLVIDYAHWGLWWAAVLNAVLVVGLIATVRLWAGKESPLHDPRPKPVMGFWLMLGIILLAATALRVPRLSLSLYNDEAYNFRNYIEGRARGDKFVEVKWSETLWDNQQAKNGPLYSSLARVCQSGAERMGWTADHLPAEWALKLPSLLGGLGSLLVLALLGRHVSGSLTGLATAFIGAVHPWHLRYSTEARPYGLALCFAALMTYFAVRAIRSGLWRWWLLFAVSEFCLMWCFAGALHFCVGLNVAAFIGRWRQDGQRWRRLVVANLFAAMLYLQLMLPAVPQIRAAVDKSPVFKAGILPTFWGDVPSLLLSGLNGWDVVQGDMGSPSVALLWAKVPWLVIGASLFLATVLAVGIMRLRVKGGGSLISLAIALSIGSAVFFHSASGKTLLTWYVIYALAPLLVCLGAGLSGLQLRCSSGDRVERWLSRLGLGLGGMAMALLGIGIAAIQARPKEDLRTATLFMRAAESNAIRAIVAPWSEGRVYDHALEVIHSEDDLTSLMEQSMNGQRPLYIDLGFETMARAQNAPVIEKIIDSGLFDKVFERGSLDEAQFQHTVYRWSGTKP